MLTTKINTAAGNQKREAEIIYRANPQIDHKRSPSTDMEKGHMVRTQQGVQSTHNNQKEVINAWLTVDNMNPTK